MVVQPELSDSKATMLVRLIIEHTLGGCTEYAVGRTSRPPVPKCRETLVRAVQSRTLGIVGTPMISSSLDEHRSGQRVARNNQNALSLGRKTRPEHRSDKEPTAWNMPDRQHKPNGGLGACHHLQVLP